MTFNKSVLSCFLLKYELCIYSMNIHVCMYRLEEESKQDKCTSLEQTSNTLLGENYYQLHTALEQLLGNLKTFFEGK